MIITSLCEHQSSKRLSREPRAMLYASLPTAILHTVTIVIETYAFSISDHDEMNIAP